MRLSVGPVLYHWDRERLFDFYRELAESLVDIVYLGETVCAKRRSLRLGEWLDIARVLAARGKQVVMSTLALMEAGSEVGQMSRLCRNGEFLVEANDAGAIGLLQENHLPFVAGSSLNIYSARTLVWLQRAGLMRWVPSVEMSGEQLAKIVSGISISSTGEVPEVELFAFGRMPLACSARCFTARAHGLTKDACGFICGRYAEGMAADAQDGQPLFVLNGIQTQSSAVVNLLRLWPEAREAGVDVLRISPRSKGTVEMLSRTRAALDDGTALSLSDIVDVPECDGYWHGRAGLESLGAA